MKSNWALRIAGLALVLTLVTSSLVAGTYAKYTTAVTGTDTARVAIFAFDLKAGADTFDQTDSIEETFNIFSHADANVINEDAAGNKIIAPGTAGNLALEIINRSEVAVEVALALTETNVNEIPVYYTIDGDASAQRYSDALNDQLYDTDKEYKSVSELADAIAVLVGDLEAYDQETDPIPAACKKAISINWVWDFEPDPATAGHTNTIDTSLGLSGTDVVTLKVAATVEQAD